MKLKLLDDEHAHGDNICLDFEGYAEAFVDLAMQTEESLTFGIFGKWGSGKTTLMRTIEQRFKGKNVYTVWFNPWEYPPEENIVKALLYTMITQEEFVGLLKDESIVNKLKPIYKVLMNLIVRIPDAHKLFERESKPEEELASEFSTLRETFKRFITALFQKEGAGGRSLLVFFIDDMDRCLPHRIVKILENIGLIFSLEHTVFFIGADRKIVADGIKYVYREHQGTDKDAGAVFDGDRYLEKMIQVPFFIPQNDKKKIEEYIKSFKIEENDILIELLNDVETNPRKIKRIINSIILSWTTYKTKKDNPGDSLDITVLAILKVIELKWANFFENLIRIINRGHTTFMEKIKALCNKPCEEGDNSGIHRKKQIEELKKIYEEDDLIFGGSNFYSSIDRNFFDFIKNPIVGDNLFKPEVLKNLPNYINATRGFSTERDSFSHEPTTFPNIEKPIEFLREGEIAEFNQMRKNSGFQKINFSGKNFSKIESSLDNVNFSECKLIESNFHGLQLKNANFEGVQLHGANFSGSDCENANFTDAKMEMVNFKNAKLEGAEFNGTDLTGANWWEAENANNVFSEEIKTRFKKPAAGKELDNWRTEFKFYHFLYEEEAST